MNFKLDVIKLNNEDVITTSVCKHKDADHYYSYDLGTSGSNKYVIADCYFAGQTVSFSNQNLYYDAFDPVIADDKGSDALNKWYYYDGVVDAYKECKGNHDDHIIKSH